MRERPTAQTTKGKISRNDELRYHREAERLCEGKRLRICLLQKKSVNNTHLSGNEKLSFRQYDVLVSTPMRLVSLIRANAVDLSGLRVIALDEAESF